MRRILGLCLSLALAPSACSTDGAAGAVDAGDRDAGDVVDAAGPADSGPSDTGPVDTGPARPDGATPDAASPPDSGPLADAGAPDAGGVPTTCAEPCASGETCCPRGVSWACVTLPADTECPLPDLTVDPRRVTSDLSFGWEFFEDADCSVDDGCVRAPGWRRLMRFSTQTPNIGTGDAYFGAPTADNPAFEYSECTMQYRFNTYAEYHLQDSGGAEVATGYKRAFCLMDTNRHDASPGVSPTGFYDCTNQGISRGWSDVYDAGLDCQWVDITDVTPGDYTLRVSLNTARRLVESSYENDDVEVSVTIPADVSRDPLIACTGGAMGPSRDCGWMLAGTFTCTPGAMVQAACGSGCSAGACTGDPVMRVCAGTMACTGREAIGSDDDCMSGVYCPRAAVTCPGSGKVTVLTAPYRAGDAFTCTVGVM